VSVAATVSEQVGGWLETLGPLVFYFAVWGLVFVGTGLFVGMFIPFITGDSLLFAAGLVTARAENLDITVLAVGVGLAAFVGDQVGFVIGRRAGRPYLKKKGGARTQKAIIWTERFYRRFGWSAVVIARFIPWARVLIPLVAGVGKMNYYAFLSANFVGAMAWGVGLTLIGYYAANIPAVKSGAYVIAAVVIGVSVLVGLRAWSQDRRQGPALSS
jgi:membrane-associated protein